MTRYTGLELLSADLVVDALYVGYKTEKGGVADPLVKLVGVSRQGGFRYRGVKEKPTLLVLTSNLCDPDWPDELDETTGRFTYYGDNKRPGRLLHDTPRFGNFLLKNIFESVHGNNFSNVPPILVFTREGEGRTFRFRGLAVPGHPALPPTEDLVAVWKTSGSQRFQNYRATFTILDEAVISRQWIQEGNGLIGSLAPASWSAWRNTGVAKPLLAPKTIVTRSRKDQLPESSGDRALIAAIRDRYYKNYFAFEVCAGAICRLLLPNISKLDLTRPWRDGGRDGTGLLKLGRGDASINVVFAIEAKCYADTHAVGVKDVSRLISRLKHREFGILVTTSYISDQAYKEVVDDGHPVILVSANDVAAVLRSAGYTTPALVHLWLDGVEKSSM